MSVAVSGALRHGLRKASRLNCREYRRGIVTEADVDQARNYCLGQLRKGDYEAYLIRQFVPKPARDAYDALRTLNLELARLPETVSNPTIGRMRMQFWRDAINNTFAGNPPREPISILLHRAVAGLAERSAAGSTKSLKFWLLRLIATREQHMDNRPFPSLAVLEDYAENTYSTLMYMTLAAIPVRSMHMDHLASHIGKACGIVSTLRGIPVLAAPSLPIQSRSGVEVGHTRPPSLILPLDVMAQAGLREEDVFRRGPEAEGLQDAVFTVATRANDHIITAREMLKNLVAGRDAGHDYEHQGETEHEYTEDESHDDGIARDIRRGFGALLDAVPAAEYLSRLEAADFDPFKVKTSWKLPLRIWQALSRETI